MFNETGQSTRSELILGGQRSGKSAQAELIAKNWLLQSPEHKAVLIATGQPWDAEMHERIQRHRRDRAQRVPNMSTVEEPLLLAETINQLSQPSTLLVVDCLTLWLTNILMPADPINKRSDAEVPFYTAMVATAISTSSSPIIIVSNEIGFGVIPMGRETRVFVDTLGRLNQEMALVCNKVTLMVAGLPLSLK